MKKSIIFLFCIVHCVLCINLYAQSRNPKYEAYIEEYSKFAIQCQNEYHIPASITLAQGILESGAGESSLAKNCNNHFGIKCGSDWYGRSTRHDDDRPNECFRCYKSAKESYDDHAKFLQRQRYAFLFDYKITDYKSWANGLRQAGYATDPKYPQKLINIIETYKLYELLNVTSPLWRSVTIRSSLSSSGPSSGLVSPPPSSSVSPLPPVLSSGLGS